MSYRARRVPDGRAVQAFDWHCAAAGATAEAASFIAFGRGAAGAATAAARVEAPVDRLGAEAVGDEPMREAGHDAADPTPMSEGELQTRVAAIERDAFAQGYAAGERSGAEAGAQRAEALVRRLTETLDELANLRRTIASDAEHDLVRLALAVAKRVVQREVQLDGDLVAALAHVALERLDARRGPATIKMHPDDVAQVSPRIGADWDRAAIRLVADASVARGGCIVESGNGRVDATLDGQLAEVTHALLGRPAEADTQARPAA